MELIIGKRYRVKSKEAYKNTPSIRISKDDQFRDSIYWVHSGGATLKNCLGEIVTLKLQREGLYSSNEYGTNFIKDSFEEEVV